MDPEHDQAATLSRRLAEAEDLDALLDVALSSFEELWGIEHSMLLVLEEDSDRLVTLASHGYDRAGVGSEVVVGVGTIGVVAGRRVPVRIGSMNTAIRYARAARQEIAREGGETRFKEIPLPGLADVESQLAVPMLVQGRLVGVICVESRSQGAFDDAVERSLSVAANQIAAGIALAALDHEPSNDRGTAVAERGAEGKPIQVRYYEEDSSVFLDGEYLIKSLPGRILWRLLLQRRDEGRSDFTNRELRLDPTLGLPAVKDNLETRLILLRRRLEEHCDAIRMVKAGRGRFRLEVGRPLELERIAAAP
ncbi:MAG: GAF domain-containing protein [Acidobacteria bacterium]|nr:GAF domain-containing protein [Acidobacteriota bacterium]